MDGQTGSPVNYVWRGLGLFAAYGDTEAIVAGERRLSYRDVHTGVLRMAATLRDHGVRSGMSVAVLASNPPEAIYLHLALHMLGCRAVWIAKAPRPHQMDFLTLAAVDAFIYAPATHETLGREFASAIPHVPVWCLGPGGAGPDLIAHEPVMGPPSPDEPVAEPLSVFQTSGTTGRPKLIIHRQKLFAALPDLAQHWVAQGRPVLRHLSIVGHWHVAAQMTVLIVLFMGGTLVLHDGFEPGKFLSLMEEQRVNSTVVSPPMLYELLDHPALPTTDLSSLLVMTCGGSALAPSRLAEAIDRLGPVVRVVYAMSESPGIAEMTAVRHDPEHPERLRSCGLPYGDVRIEVRGPDGKPLPAREIGEVWISSVLVMDGYWGDPELTSATLVDGWMRTGDIGYHDEHGYLFLVDRRQDMILTGVGSTNVYTRPIEDALMAHPQVGGAAVIGVPDVGMGEAPYAYVVAAREATVTEQELRELVVTTLNETWAPRTVEFIDRLPLVAMGKVDKGALRERYQAAQSATAGGR